MKYFSWHILLNIVICMSSVETLHPVIVRGEIWRKKHDDGSYHYVYNMYDIHTGPYAPEPQLKTKINNLVVTQREVLIRNFKQLNPKSTKILIEDMASNPDGTYVMPMELLNAIDKLSSNADELLAKFFMHLKTNGISQAFNIEYRQKRLNTITYTMLRGITETLAIIANMPMIVAQLGDNIIKEYNAYQQAGMTEALLLKFKPQLEFTIGDLKGEVDAVLNKIKNYQDGPILSQYYQMESDNIKNLNTKINQILNSSQEKTFRVFIRTTNSDIFQMVFPVYGGHLLDVNALHEIYQDSQAIQKTFLIAGCAHVYNVADMLPQLDYELIYETGINKSIVKRAVKNINDGTDTDTLMNMSIEKASNSLQPTITAMVELLTVFQKRNPFNMSFFDLLLVDNPEAGWQPGHGVIQ